MRLSQTAAQTRCNAHRWNSKYDEWLALRLEHVCEHRRSSRSGTQAFRCHHTRQCFSQIVAHMLHETSNHCNKHTWNSKYDEGIVRGRGLLQPTNCITQAYDCHNVQPYTHCNSAQVEQQVRQVTRARARPVPAAAHAFGVHDPTHKTFISSRHHTGSRLSNKFCQCNSLQSSQVEQQI